MDTSTLYVKGFVNHGSDIMHKSPCFTGNSFQAVMTDLTETILIDVTSAVKENNIWRLNCTDGKTILAENEPENIRYMEYSKLVSNFCRTIFRDTFDEIPYQEYNKVYEKIANGSRDYRLIGYVNGQQVITGPIVKAWENQGEADAYRYHAITHSGSHYAFY